MRIFPLTFSPCFAPADNGAGAGSAASPAPAPAAAASPAQSTSTGRGLSLLDLTGILAGEARKQQNAAPADKDTPGTTPSASASAGDNTGRDPGAAAPPEGAADPENPAAPDAAGPDDLDVTPDPSATPERQAQQLAGIEKLKTRAQEAKAEAERLRQELETLKAAPLKKDEPAAKPSPSPAPAGDALFLANSEEEIISLVEREEAAILLGEDLLERMADQGLDADEPLTLTNSAGQPVKLTRAQVRQEIKQHRQHIALKDRALLHLKHRRETAGEAARLHPEMFPSGRPSPAVQAVLNEVPELQARHDGLRIAAEIASARAARAATAAKPATKPASTPTPAPASTRTSPVPAAAAAPAAAKSQQTPPPTQPKRGISVRDLAGLLR